MRGRKPKLDNVVPMRTDALNDADLRERNTKRAIARLMPRGLEEDMRKEWRRVARILADPTVDRLKPRFVDVIRDYCRVCIRLRRLDDAMPTLQREIYNAAQGDNTTRNGLQIKAHPFVAQRNETWRQWRSLVQMLGLSPADERNMVPGQGDMFDDTDKYF